MMSQSTATPAEKDTALHLTWKERIEILRSNRHFLAIFPFVMLVAVIAVFGIWTGGRFFRPSVLKGVLSQGIIVATCATGVAFIYSNGNLDISIGAVLGLAATFGAMAFNATGSAPVMVVVCLLTAMAIMLFNCTMSVVCHIKTITVAIVMTQIYNAFTTILIGGAGKIDVDPQMASAMNGGFYFIAFFAYVLLGVVVFHFTRVGRSLRFLGGNESCAEQTGISNAKMTYVSFLMTGIGVGLAAVFSITNVAAVSVETGDGMGMDVMLATVLGGMSIFGGSRSNAYAGVLGAITVVALNKGMLMIGVSAALIQGIRGVIFLLLVWMNSERQSLLPARNQF